MRKLMFLFIAIFLAGCRGSDWGSEYARGQAGRPVSLEESLGPPAADGVLRTVAVLLPLSGPDGALGTGIQHAIEIAFFQQQPTNVLVSFHDIAGREEDKRRTIETVLSQNPSMIIGPLFASDVQMLKKMKPRNIPAITFTSSRAPLGDGIFTMALMPNQAVETVVKHMAEQGRSRVVVIAPDTQTGWMLANSARDSVRAHGIELSGLLLYTEGDTQSMREVIENATFFGARVQTLTEARRILSEAMMRHNLTHAESEPLRLRLEELNRRDTLGGVPYDSILILGNATDSKTITAYLRYYDVPPTMAGYFGSALWDSEVAFRDGAMATGEFAALPRIPESFLNLFSEIEGVRPNRFNTLGYDAAMLAMRSLSSTRSVGANLLDPSGYTGVDGLVRLRPNGENERSLVIMQLNGVTQPRVIKPAPATFMTKIYQTGAPDLSRPSERQISNEGYNPMDFITLPERLRGTFRAERIGNVRHAGQGDIPLSGEHIEVMADDEVIVTEDFSPATGTTITRTEINEVQMRPAQ